MRGVRRQPSRHDKGELSLTHVDALAWIEGAGEGFALWATIVGWEPCRLRTWLLSRIAPERLTEVRADRAEHERQQRRGRRNRTVRQSGTPGVSRRPRLATLRRVTGSS